MAKIFAILIFCVFLTGGAGQNVTNQLITSKGYRLEYFEDALNYTAAYEKCRGRGDSLVVIKTDTMKKYVHEVITPAYGVVYIGLNRSGDQWIWNDCTNLLEDEANWCAVGDCSNDPDGDCAIFQQSSGKWNDINCALEKYHVCQTDVLILTPADDEVIVVEGDVSVLDVHVKSLNGPVDVKIYKLPVTTTPVDVENNVVDYTVRYRTGLTEERDAGIYKFVASKSGTRAYIDETTVSLVVHVPVDITQASPSNIASPVTIGSNFAMCMAHGIPLPKATWMKNGVEVSTVIKEGVYQQKSNESAILFIENAQPQEAGTYTCFAENYIGESSLKRKTDSEDITLSGWTIFSPTLM